MLAALDRHLGQNESKISIANDREFMVCGQVLEGKARTLREKGYGKRPNAAKALTVQDEEQLWMRPQSKITPLYPVISADPSFWPSRLPKAPCNACRRVHLEQGRTRYKVYNI